MKDYDRSQQIRGKMQTRLRVSKLLKHATMNSEPECGN